MFLEVETIDLWDHISTNQICWEAIHVSCWRSTTVIKDAAPKSKEVLLYGLGTVFSHRYNSRHCYCLSASLFLQTWLISEMLFQLSYPCSFSKNLCTSQPSSHSCGKGDLRSRERIRNNIVLGRVVSMIYTAMPVVVYLQRYNKLFDCLHWKPIQ